MDGKKTEKYLDSEIFFYIVEYNRVLNQTKGVEVTYSPGRTLIIENVLNTQTSNDIEKIVKKISTKKTKLGKRMLQLLLQ